MDITKIGDFIKDKRKEKGFTQAYIAKKLSISPQAVSKWERSESLPDITLLPQLAEILGINTDDILNGGQVDEIDSTKDIVSVINAFIDDKLFDDITDEFINAKSINAIKIPFDIFMFLNNVQKEILIDLLLDIEDYNDIIEDIINFLGNSQKKAIVKSYLERKEYEKIEGLLPFLSPQIKSFIIKTMFERKEYVEVENILPFLSKKQKYKFIDYIYKANINIDIIDNYIPFLDIDQQSYLREMLEGGSKDE